MLECGPEKIYNALTESTILEQQERSSELLVSSLGIMLDCAFFEGSVFCLLCTECFSSRIRGRRSEQHVSTDKEPILQGFA